PCRPLAPRIQLSRRPCVPPLRALVGDALVQVAAAPCGSPRCRRRGLRGKTRFQTRDPPDQFAGGVLRCLDLSFDLLAPFRFQSRALGLALEAGDEISQTLADAFDLLFEPGEGALDLLDG